MALENLIPLDFERGKMQLKWEKGQVVYSRNTTRFSKTFCNINFQLYHPTISNYISLHKYVFKRPREKRSGNTGNNVWSILLQFSCWVPVVNLFQQLSIQETKFTEVIIGFSIKQLEQFGEIATLNPKLKRWSLSKRSYCPSTLKALNVNISRCSTFKAVCLPWTFCVLTPYKLLARPR